MLILIMRNWSWMTPYDTDKYLAFQNGKNDQILSKNSSGFHLHLWTFKTDHIITMTLISFKVQHYFNGQKLRVDSS